jgi:hypothetical protein
MHQTTEQLNAATAVDEIMKDEAKLKMEAAKKWIAVIEAYKDPASPLYISYMYAKQTLESVKSSLKLPADTDVLLKQIDELMTEAAALGDKTPAEADHKAYVKNLLETSKSYLVFEKAHHDKMQFHYLKLRASIMVKKAQRALHKHKHHHKHTAHAVAPKMDAMADAKPKA